jgi:hypothetical protein
MRLNKLISSLALILVSVFAKAQDPNVALYIDNPAYLSSGEFEFDIMMKATGSTSAFELRTFQTGLYLSSAWTSGGTITAHNASNYSEMSGSGYNGVFQWNPTDNLLNCSVNFDVVGPTTCISTTVTSAPLLITRIRLTNSTDFNCLTPDIKFNYVSNISPLRLRTTFSWRAVGCTTNYDMFYPGRTYTGNATFNNEVYSINDADGKSPVSSTGGVGFCEGQITVTAFLEGYYDNGHLNPALLNCQILHANAEQADSITVELHSTLNTSVVSASFKTILSTTGKAYCVFSLTGGLLTNSYWLVIRHRNAMETWSASPILISARTSYDFTIAQTQAFGSNMVMTNDAAGWAFYSGDISDPLQGGVGYQDGVIESQDYSDMENAVYLTVLGYTIEDVTGDGVVESADYSIMENNVYFTIVAQRP